MYRSASTALTLRGGGFTEVPFYAMCFYTVNTLMFATGMMDSMMVSMMGTSEAALPIVQGPIVKAMFFGFTVCNAAIAALLSTGDKFTQLVAACFMFGFAFPMALMFKSGMMGTPGLLQYGVMNTIFGSIALKNYLS